MKEKILISWLMICLVAGMTGAGTFAYLSDTESSTGTFTAGTLDLKIKDQDERFYGDGVTATWTLSNMKPGDSVSGWVRLRNDGCIEPHHLDIDVSNTVIDPPGPESDAKEGTDDLDKHMFITHLNYTYYTGTVKADLSDLSDLNNDGKISLDEFESQGLHNLPAPPDKNKFYTLNMTLQFDPLAGNDYQGDMLNMTMTFTLH